MCSAARGGCGCHGSVVPRGTVSSGDDKTVDVCADDRNLEPSVRVIESHLHCAVLAVILGKKEHQNIRAWSVGVVRRK